MPRPSELYAQTLRESINATEEVEAAGLMRYLTLLERIRRGEKIGADELRAVGYYCGTQLRVQAQMMAWAEKATRVDVEAGGAFGGFTLKAGYSHSSASGEQTNVTVQVQMERVMRTEGMAEVLTALPEVSPQAPVGPLLPPSPGTPEAAPGG